MSRKRDFNEKFFESVIVDKEVKRYILDWLKKLKKIIRIDELKMTDLFKEIDNIAYPVVISKIGRILYINDEENKRYLMTINNVEINYYYISFNKNGMNYCYNYKILNSNQNDENDLYILLGSINIVYDNHLKGIDIYYQNHSSVRIVIKETLFKCCVSYDICIESENIRENNDVFLYDLLKYLFSLKSDYEENDNKYLVKLDIGDIFNNIIAIRDTINYMNIVVSILKDKYSEIEYKNGYVNGYSYSEVTFDIEGNLISSDLHRKILKCKKEDFF